MQHRDPPAYQEYASSVLAKSSFRELTLEQRGLLYTLKLECWVNKNIPKDSKKLAQYVGSSEQQIAELLPSIMEFFAAKNDRIFSPELENYREHLSKISEARKKGAIKTNSIKSTKTALAQATNERTQKTRSSVNYANAEITLPSLVQFSSVQSSLVSSSTNGEYTYNPDEEEQL